MKKKFAIVFLSLFLVVSLPFAAHANIVTATGKYLINAVKKIPGGAKVEATNTVTGAKHVINHGVSASALGTAIGGGIVGFGVATGAGLAFKAITGLALDAVDWVMDPANNQIKWKKKGEGGVDDAGNPNPKVWYLNPIRSDGDKKYTASSACKIYGSYHSDQTWKTYTYTFNARTDTCNFNVVYKDSRYPPSVDKKVLSRHPDKWLPSDGDADAYKLLPLVDLAKKIIEQADAGQVDSQQTIEDYVTNLAKEGELDNELDNATDITEPQNPEEPNPDEPQECPSGSVKVDDVCVKIPDSDGDEPLFCDSSEFTKKVCDWIDWTQVKHDEPEADAGKVDVIDKSKDLNIDQNRIDFTNQCPAPTPINTSVGGFPVSTELNYQPLCDFFTMLNPFVVGMGGISSALIIAGGARRG